MDLSDNKLTAEVAIDFAKVCGHGEKKPKFFILSGNKDIGDQGFRDPLFSHPSVQQPPSLDTTRRSYLTLGGSSNTSHLSSQIGFCSVSCACSTCRNATFHILFTTSNASTTQWASSRKLSVLSNCHTRLHRHFHFHRGVYITEKDHFSPLCSHPDCSFSRCRSYSSASTPSTSYGED